MGLTFIIAFLLPLACFAASGITPATSISSGSYYYIRNKNSGHYLDAENSLNFNVIQYNYHGALNQAWKITKISGNVYRLENQSPYYQNQGRMCLSVSEVDDEVDLYYLSASLVTQRWEITANSDGTFKVKSMLDNKVLQTQSASTASPANVNKGTSNNANNQKWYFEKIPTPQTTLSALKSAFPHGKYWNHSPSSSNNYTSVRTVACTHHGNCKSVSGSYDGACGCNSYYTSIQCNGFARYMAKRMYGTDIPSWKKSTDSSAVYFAKPGDYIRYNGHSVIVIGVSSNQNKLILLECNYGGACIIRWEREESISTIMNNNFEHIYKSPYVFI